jgi:hypothetical protein
MSDRAFACICLGVAFASAWCIFEVVMALVEH